MTNKFPRVRPLALILIVVLFVFFLLFDIRYLFDASKTEQYVLLEHDGKKWAFNFFITVMTVLDGLSLWYLLRPCPRGFQVALVSVFTSALWCVVDTVMLCKYPEMARNIFLQKSHELPSFASSVNVNELYTKNYCTNSLVWEVIEVLPVLALLYWQRGYFFRGASTVTATTPSPRTSQVIASPAYAQNINFEPAVMALLATIFFSLASSHIAILLFAYQKNEFYILFHSLGRENTFFLLMGTMLVGECLAVWHLVRRPQPAGFWYLVLSLCVCTFGVMYLNLTHEQYPELAKKAYLLSREIGGEAPLSEEELSVLPAPSSSSNLWLLALIPAMACVLLALLYRCRNYFFKPTHKSDILSYFVDRALIGLVKTNENGQKLFLPWGEHGQGYIVENSRAEAKLSMGIKAIFFMIVVLIILMILLLYVSSAGIWALSVFPLIFVVFLGGTALVARQLPRTSNSKQGKPMDSPQPLSYHPLFRTDKRGRRIFLPQGLLGKAYIVPSQEKEVELRADRLVKLRKMLVRYRPAVVVICVIIGLSLGRISENQKGPPEHELLVALLLGVVILALALLFIRLRAPNKYIKSMTIGLEVINFPLTWEEWLDGLSASGPRMRSFRQWTFRVGMMLWTILILVGVGFALFEDNIITMMIVLTYAVILATPLVFFLYLYYRLHQAGKTENRATEKPIQIRPKTDLDREQ